MCDFRRLRVHDLAIIAALPFAVGLPLLWVQHLLFAPSGYVFSLLTSGSLSPDTVTAVSLGLYCLLLAFALLAGHRFLRRFLRRRQRTVCFSTWFSTQMHLDGSTVLGILFP